MGEISNSKTFLKSFNNWADKANWADRAGRAAWADNNNISISLNIICYIMDAISTSIEINCRYYECNIKGEIRDHLCPDG